MGNKVYSINNQVARFQEHGLDLSCYEESKLKEILLDIGYYRLGFYSYYFKDHKSEHYIDGIKISDIVNLYYLDLDLKYILLKYINRIEINFRTKVIYYISMKYKGNSLWYVDPEIMNPEHIRDFKKKIYTEKFKKDNVTLKKHHEKYPDDKFAPCWKVFEYLSFGAILKIYEHINDDEVKQRVSEKYNVRDLKKFLNYLNAVRHVRNICAHSGVLFDYSLPLSVPSHPEIDFNKGDRNSPDAIFKVISFFMKSISVNRFNDFHAEINDFFAHHNQNDILAEIIRDKIKYVYH